MFGGKTMKDASFTKASSWGSQEPNSPPRLSQESRKSSENTPLIQSKGPNRAPSFKNKTYDISTCEDKCFPCCGLYKTLDMKPREVQEKIQKENYRFRDAFLTKFIFKIKNFVRNSIKFRGGVHSEGVLQ